MPTMRSALASLVVLMAVATTAACAHRSGDNVNGDSRQQQIEELLKRPDIDDVVSRYERMRTEIRERVAAETGLPQWKDNDTASASGCREFPDIDGDEKESRGLTLWYAEASLPDDKWPRAVEIFAEITRSYGFESPPRVIVDRPGNHEVAATDQFGANVILGTKLNTVLSLLTGCHPTYTGRHRLTPMTS